MKIKLYKSAENGELFSATQAYEEIKDDYWEEICSGFLEQQYSYDIISQLFYGGCNFYEDDFDIFTDEFIDDVLSSNYKEVIIEIDDNDIVGN